MLDRHPRIERRRERRIPRPQRQRPLPAVDCDAATIDREFTDRAETARGVEELARWIHLQRSHRERQRVIAWLSCRVDEAITHDQLRTVRNALREGSDAQCEVAMLPV